MKTLILSSSLSKESKSFILCKEVEKELIKKKIDPFFVDARSISVNPFHAEISLEENTLKTQINNCDNIIIGMGVHCYSINDNLKILLDNCFEGAKGKFFGILCAAGGERSYLATQHLTQICMNEWRMLQLPRIVYATKKDFNNTNLISKEVQKRIIEFSKEFYDIGCKLLT